MPDLFRFTPAIQSVNDIFLRPGEFHFGQGHLRLRTLLGSCIAIVLWVPKLNMGGMCHFMLPQRRHRIAAPTPDGRYADEAMQLFDQALLQYGISAQQCQAKLFGGGRMFGEHIATLDIGERNLTAAYHLLAERRIPIVAEHVGGYGHRRIVFDIWSGDVWVSFQEGIA